MASVCKDTYLLSRAKGPTTTEALVVLAGALVDLAIESANPFALSGHQRSWTRKELRWGLL